MKWNVLISAPYMQPVPGKYRQILEDIGVSIVEVPVEERLEEEELIGIIADIDGVISGDDRFTEKVFKAAKKLKVISKWGTGIDSIDQEVAKKYGVAIRNTPNAFTVPVSDTVLGYMLCFARKLPSMDREMKEGKWGKIPGYSLSECTLGIIGVGNIGKAVIRRAAAFGMKILGNDIIDIPQDFIKTTGLEVVSKNRLLNEADFVSINCDLNSTSHHIMSKKEFEQMKPTSFLINTARGALVDEKALVLALKGGQLAGAAMDVFEEEPLPLDSPLRTMDNVMIAPHNSNSSPLAWERVHESTVNNLIEELRKESR